MKAFDTETSCMLLNENTFLYFQKRPLYVQGIDYQKAKQNVTQKH